MHSCRDITQMPMSFPALPRSIRAVGFDDAPFQRGSRAKVGLAGVVCNGTRFEGLVWGSVKQDGWNATDAVTELLVGRKFLPQIHLVLLDGIAFGGFNVVDLPELAARLRRPCVAVMRRAPDMVAMEKALARLPASSRRLATIRRAGPIHHEPPFTFQVCGSDADEIAPVLTRLTDRGNVPEPLRLAHLIGSAFATGESGHRA